MIGIRMWWLTCPACGGVFEGGWGALGPIRLGYEYLICPRCRQQVRTGALEWRHLNVREKWGYFFDYWIIGIMVCAIVVAPALTGDDAFIMEVAIASIIGIKWAAKGCRILASLKRCSTVAASQSLMLPNPASMRVFWISFPILIIATLGIVLLKEGLLRDASLLIALIAVLMLVRMYRRRGFG